MYLQDDMGYKRSRQERRFPGLPGRGERSLAALIPARRTADAELAVSPQFCPVPDRGAAPERQGREPCFFREPVARCVTGKENIIKAGNTMAHILRLAGIEEESIVDGPGLRMTVFVQGCLLGCPGCQNPQTHDLNGGTEAAAEDILEKFCADPLLAGITFSGGEPFLQPEPLLWLAREVHARGRNVMSFSGYTFEQLMEKSLKNPPIRGLLDELDALVDGPYIEKLRNIDLLYRGSENQRYLKRADLDRLREAWLAGHGVR